MSLFDDFSTVARPGASPRRPLAAGRQACIRFGVAALIIMIMMLVLPRPAPAQSRPPVGEASLSTDGGYARLTLTFADPVEAQIRLSGNVMVVGFGTPVAINVERLTANQNGWISAARRDPDGRGLRIAVSRKVKPRIVNTGERVFIDLLPDSWIGAAPGLPQDVVEELARRAREAEAAIRARAVPVEERRGPPVRVRASSQPTFDRYIFDLTELTAIATERADDSLTLTFGAPLRFDLAEAKLAMVPPVSAIEEQSGSGNATIMFRFSAPADVRSFREDRQFVVDVTPVHGKARAEASDDRSQLTKLAAATGPLPELEPPQTIPARSPSSSGGPAKQLAPVVSTPARVAVPAPKPVLETADGSPKAEKPVVEAPAPTTPVAQPAIEAPARPAAERFRSVSAATPGVPVALHRSDNGLRLTFPFQTITPAAIFVRGDTLWAVFRTDTALDLDALGEADGAAIGTPSVTPAEGAQVVRIPLDRPRIATATADGPAWLIDLSDGAAEPLAGAELSRNTQIPGRSTARLPIARGKPPVSIVDADTGDTLSVVTASGAAQSVLRIHPLVDFTVLASAQGAAILRHSDDLAIDVADDAILFRRPHGLSLSDAAAPRGRYDYSRIGAFDTRLWGFDREADFAERHLQLTQAAADAPVGQRHAPRLELARFYMARGLYPEAKSVLDIAILDERATADDPNALVLRAVASLMLERPVAALKDIGHPLLVNNQETRVWRAMALAQQGKWAEASDSFRQADLAMPTLPVELHRLVLRETFRTALEAGELATAANKLSEFEAAGIPRAMQPAISVLNGRLKEAQQNTDEALASYRLAVESADRRAAAQARLRELAILYRRNALSRTDAINELETLTTIWRGDETEVEALQSLAQFYTEEARYREAFGVMRLVLRTHPKSETSRRIHDNALATFDALFLAGRADALPAVEAVSLFYDFRELTPNDRRGDEIIRRLADRLVAVDLLDQAADLLRHQVDNRLQGAARAQVAARIAVIELLNGKPAKAQEALRATRNASLSNDLRRQRILLEARSLSDQGRKELALDVIGTMEGREVTRLRGDILWSLQRWQTAAEQVELLAGARWRDFEPLNDRERIDVLRATLGYALAGDALGLSRLRDRFAAKMMTGPDRQAFSVVSQGLGTDASEFRTLAKTIASADTLGAFLDDMQGRYADLAIAGRRNAPATPGETGSIAKPILAASAKR